jgi:CRP-like cAMP-binding protein
MAPSPFRRTDHGGGAATRNRPGHLLDRVPLLALLEPELRARVRKRLAQRKVATGKALFRQGEPADALYLVESGRLRVFVGDRVGHERVLRFVGPGDMVGEAAFMAETPHVTSAVAVDAARVWRLARADFDTLLADQEPALRYLASVVAERQAQANARLAAEQASEEALSLRGYVTALYSPRGGAGVTTLAIALGVALAERHPDDTVLLDLDVLFGHVTSNLWLNPRGALAQAASGTLQALDRAGLDFYLLPHSSSLRVFPSAMRPEEGQTVTGDQVRAAVTALRRHFGHVVLDLPHGFSDVALAGLELADRILLLATPEAVTLRDVLECRRIFTDVLRLPPERISYVLNHPLPYTAVPTSEFAAATATPWAEVPFGGDGPTMAALRGESLVSSRPTNPVSKAAVQLAQTVSRQAGEAAAVAGRPA